MEGDVCAHVGTCIVLVLKIVLQQGLNQKPYTCMVALTKLINLLCVWLEGGTKWDGPNFRLFGWGDEVRHDHSQEKIFHQNKGWCDPSKLEGR